MDKHDRVVIASAWDIDRHPVSISFHSRDNVFYNIFGIPICTIILADRENPHLVFIRDMVEYLRLFLHKLIVALKRVHLVRYDSACGPRASVISRSSRQLEHDERSVLVIFSHTNCQMASISFKSSESPSSAS